MNLWFPNAMLIAILNLFIATPLLAESTHPPIKEIAPGNFQLGSVVLNKEERAVRFPATVNMTNGLIEYFVVTGTGKLHESLLKTEIEPSQIHVAMLLLGAADSSTNRSSTNVLGDKVSIEVSWKTNGTQKRIRAEELVWNGELKAAMKKSPWIYNGSKVIDGTFIAQRDGSIVSVIADPLALANSLQPNRDNDEIWSVNTNAVPPLNTPVEITLKLEPPQKGAKDTK